MIDLHRYFQNPFDDPEISLNGLLAFSTDHLQRMIANNSGGSYSSADRRHYGGVAGGQSSTTDDLTKLGVRKARASWQTDVPQSVAGKDRKVSGRGHRGSARRGGGGGAFSGRRKFIFTKKSDDKLVRSQTPIAGVTAHQAQLAPSGGGRRRRCA